MLPLLVFDARIATTTTVATRPLFEWQNNGTALMQMDASGNMSKFRGVATGGFGVPAIYASGRNAAVTNTAASTTATYTVGAADGTFQVSANILVLTATTHAFTAFCTYQDEGGTTRTLTLSFTLVAGGTLVTSIANGNGAVPYMGIPQLIRAKAATDITIGTTGTFTTVVYNISALITQVA